MCFGLKLENYVIRVGFPDECGSQLFNKTMQDHLIQPTHVLVLPVMVTDWAKHLVTIQKGSCADLLFL